MRVLEHFRGTPFRELQRGHLGQSGWVSIEGKRHSCNGYHSACADKRRRIDDLRDQPPVGNDRECIA
jgi:hypothetical protein